MKKIHSIWAMLLIMMCSITFAACGSDDDEEEGGSSSLIGGRWIALENMRKSISSDAVEFPEWFEGTESFGGYVSWKFLDSNTAVKFYTEIYAYKRNDAFYTENIAGHQMYFVEGDSETYSYAVKDGLIYITNGTILTWGDGYLLDGGIKWEKK